MRLRFSIRDLLWLTLVVAILVAWWVDYEPQRYEVYQRNTDKGSTLHILMDTKTKERWIVDTKRQPLNAN